MKCPKCGYLGFETVERCRNCGYEFALASAPAPAAPDLGMRDVADPGGPLPDLALRGVPQAQPREGGVRTLDMDRVIGAPADAAADLPLFGAHAEPDLEPLVSAAAPPRRPLAVRRPTPEPGRVRRAVREPARAAARTLELPLPPEPPPMPAALAPGPDPFPEAPIAREAAAPSSRLCAAGLDLLLLGAIDLLVLYFTLRMCQLGTSEWHLLPLVPFAAFLIILNGGYLVGFTAAGGQTLGKMAFGLRVVGEADEAVGVGPAVVRALGCLASVACFGAGLVPVLIGRGRAIHDRLAATDVVRAA